MSDETSAVLLPTRIPHTPLVREAFAHPPYWASQKLLPWDEEQHRKELQFATSYSWSSQQSINVFEVVGTAHPDYIGLSWLEFLEQGKRMRNNVALQESNPDYYLNQEIKQPTMFYVRTSNTGWYVNGDGNHRTCLARFFFGDLGRTMLHGVTVGEHRIDHHALWVYSWLQDLIAQKGIRLQIEPSKKKLARDDSGGWMRESFALGVRYVDLRSKEEGTLTISEAEQLAMRLDRKMGFREWIHSRTVKF